VPAGLEIDKVEVVAVDESHKSVIANLIQLYLYDMAAQSVFPVNSLGLYDYDNLDLFWEHPYLFYLDGDIAGFALVISHCPIRNRSPCWFMAEFCVLRPYQRKGIGRAALHSIFGKHDGDWEIAWLTDNVPADEFWRAALPDSGQPYRHVTFDAMDWTSTSFRSHPAQKD
jgi:predicted acetyltransferase